MGNSLSLITGRRLIAVPTESSIETTGATDRTGIAPPGVKDGSYFGTFFFMGGEKFVALQPEAFLYGSLTDLAFLPVMAPRSEEEQYVSSKNHATVLKALIHLKKQSVRLIKTVQEDEIRRMSITKSIKEDVRKLGKNERENMGTNGHERTRKKEIYKNDEERGTQHIEGENKGWDVVAKNSTGYHVEFTFDSLVDCVITIHTGATESRDLDGNMCFEAQASSKPYYYPAGMGQLFKERWLLDVNNILEEERVWRVGVLKFPLVIVLQTANYQDSRHTQYQATVGSLEESSMGIFNVSILKQKFSAMGTSYMLQDIYGIEQTDEWQTDAANKWIELAEKGTDAGEKDCIVCMCEPRDTLVLPCRHLCMCHECADVLRYQAGKCPICRISFHSLLHLRVAKQKALTADETAEGSEIHEVNGEGKYHCVSIVNSAQPITINPVTDQAPSVNEEEDRIPITNEKVCSGDSSQELQSVHLSIELRNLPR